MGEWWRWSLVSPNGVVPSRMVGVSASVNLPLHHKAQKFSSGTGSPGWARKKGRKMVVLVVWWCSNIEASLRMAKSCREQINLLVLSFVHGRCCCCAEWLMLVLRTRWMFWTLPPRLVLFFWTRKMWVVSYLCFWTSACRPPRWGGTRLDVL